MGVISCGGKEEFDSKMVEAKATGKPAVIEFIATCALFRSPPNSKFFHSLSITLIFRRMHGALNVYKKITNCTVWL